MNECKVGKTQE